MIDLSDSARTSLERYLEQVRMCLWGYKTVDADEVERSVREHVESEFEGATGSVTSQELDEVLCRLGSPSQWVPEEELSLWRKVCFGLRSGAEDWRLAHLCFGMLVVGFIILSLGYVVLSAIFILASFILARAAMSAGDASESFKAQRWLLYPSLIVAYPLICCVLLLGLSGLLLALADDFEGTIRRSHMQFRDDLDYSMMAWSFAVAGAGLSWTVLGALLLKWWRFPQVVFRPFGDWFRRRWALWLLLVGLLLLVPSLGLGIGYWL